MDFKFLQKDITYSPSRFFNRELSLLKFHDRVLSECAKSSLPLFERMKFLAISGSNLDEFCMVRFAGLKAKRVDEENISIDGLNFKEQIKLTYPYLKKTKEKQFKLFNDLQKDLNKEDIYFINPQRLDKKEITSLEKTFIKQILPTLIIHDIDKEFPFIENLTFNILVETGDDKKIISLPRKFQRFFSINQKNKKSFITMEDLILLFIDKVFPEHRPNVMAVFTIHRDTLIPFNENAEDIIAWFEQALEKRKQGNITLLEIRSDADISAISYLINKLKLGEHDIISSEFLAYRHLMQIISNNDEGYLFKKYSPRKLIQTKEHNNDYFKAIANEDILAHHPYESYDVVVNFLKQAANDKDVISIKQTIYRTNKESPIMYALMDAAKNGKDVTAFIELRARFDEEANLEWAKIMESHGIKVIFGHPQYKFHGKISLVTKKSKGRIKSYVHYGTGNYNPLTANFYTDLSFFTCDKILCQDAETLFNFLTTKQEPEPFNKLVISPYYTRDKILELIDAEIEFVKQGKPGTIWAKANSLMDDVIIDALYRASNAGVKIKLVIRGICALRPGIKGLSENITVKSIVGRFLEHSRIYCFGNGKKIPSSGCKVFISSADLMRRNMIKRIETLVPIEKIKIKKQILNQIMYANIKDTANSWILDKDMNYTQSTVKPNGFSAQSFFMNNPSLSVPGSSEKLKRKVRKTK